MLPHGLWLVARVSMIWKRIKPIYPLGSRAGALAQHPARIAD